MALGRDCYHRLEGKGIRDQGARGRVCSTSPEGARPEYDQEIDRLRSAYRIGVSIAFGTDAITELPGLTRGSTAMQWIDSYVAAGFTPRDILRAMTATAARTLGLEKERGAIRSGMFADLIATRTNPLEDLNALKQVAFVMKNGRVVKEVRP